MSYSRWSQRYRGTRGSANLRARIKELERIRDISANKHKSKAKIEPDTASRLAMYSPIDLCRRTTGSVISAVRTPVRGTTSVTRIAPQQEPRRKYQCKIKRAGRDELRAGSEQHGPDGQMQLVNQASAQILTDSGYAAPEPMIAGDTSEQRQACDRAALRPTSVSSCRPTMRRGWGAEHVARANPGANAGKALFCDSVVDSSFSVVMAVHLAP